MSTWAAHAITCPSCEHAFEIPLLKGMHITRLPEVRSAIVDGSFQVFACPECGVPTGVERPTVYTDFANKLYIAMELSGLADVAERRAVHQRVFDECFLFGPDVAAELAQGMTCRLVLGVRALREKVLSFEHGLDDRALEGVKLTVAGERGWNLREVQLRLLAVHQGGHLLFGLYPVRRREPSAASRVVPNDPAIDHVTVRASTLAAITAEPGRLRGLAPWLFEPWVVDASIGSIAWA